MSCRVDFYGLCKGWRIIFVIFFTPAYHRTNPVNQLVANRIQNQHRVFTLAEFAYIVVLKIAFHLDGRHGAHVNQRFQPFSGVLRRNTFCKARLKTINKPKSDAATRPSSTILLSVPSSGLRSRASTSEASVPSQ